MRLVGGLVAVIGLVGCTGESGAAGTEGQAGPRGANALARVVAEPPGSHCAEGGQAFLVGVDTDGSGALDDGEVTSKAFVCNGAETAASLTPIAKGDPRCPEGGVAFQAVGEGSDLVACNGANGTNGTNGADGTDGVDGKDGETGAAGAKGDTGAAGAKGETGAAGPKGDPGAAGAKGDQGDPGLPAPEPKLGRFLASQIVRGAVLTCATSTSDASTSTCNGMKMNGLEVRLAPTEANLICAAVTGKSYSSAGGVGMISAPYIVSISATWAISDSGTTAPMQNLLCNR